MTIWSPSMNNYDIKKTSGTSTGTALITGAIFLVGSLGLGLDQCQQDHKSLNLRPNIYIQESSKTFGQYTNVFTGEYENLGLDFDEAVTSFYAEFLAAQEPLGKEFEEVLYDNLWDLIVRT